MHCIEKYIQVEIQLCCGKYLVIKMMNMQGYKIWLSESLRNIYKRK